MSSAAGLAAGPDGCLPELDYPPLLQSRVSMVYYVLFAEVFFPVLTLYSPRSIVWGLFFSSSLSSCLLYFSSKNPCISLLIVLCMIVYVTNKPTLTLTLDPGTQEAMAGLEARETMAYFFWVARAGQGAPWP